MKGRVADPGVHQVDVDLQGEPGVGVAQPLRDLLHVAPGLEQQGGAGVAEGVERDPGEARGLNRRSEHPAAEVPVGEREALRAGEDPLGCGREPQAL